MYNKPHVILIQTCKFSAITKHYKDKYPYPPFGLLYCEGILKMNGYNVTIIDLFLEQITSQAFIEILSNQLSPVLIGISSYTDSIQDAYVVAKVCKKVYPNIPIVIGGAHATFMYEEILKECSDIDFCLAVCKKGDV